MVLVQGRHSYFGRRAADFGLAGAAMTFVPRFVLRNLDGGFLVDDNPLSDRLKFCTYPRDARQFFSKRTAEQIGKVYGLEVETCKDPA